MVSKLVITSLLIGIILILSITQATAYAQQPSVVVKQLNSAINKALSKCGITVNNFVVPENVTMSNNTLIINLGLSNNYNVELTMSLIGNVMPIRGVNITVLTNNGAVCYQEYAPIETMPGNYNYTVLRTRYFVEVISFVGATPIVTISPNSLITYGTTMRSIVVIPTVVGHVVCNTGELTPVYMVTVLNKPIMYLIQPETPIRSLLCRYSQNVSVSYLLMYILIGVASALIYMAVLLIVKVLRSPIT
jgi:hypothetical protein